MTASKTTESPSLSAVPSGASLPAPHDLREGAPLTPCTVVLDESCASLAGEVSKFARTITFTRSGGFRVEPRIAATELHDMLGRSDAQAPYVLVGASYAGFTQLLFAEQWQKSVAGLVLVDPSHPLQGVKALARLSAGDVGNSETMERFRSMLRGFGPAWEEGCRQVSEVSSLGDVPMIVLAAGALEMPAELAPGVRAELMRDRLGLLREYAGLTSKGELVVVEGVGHNITADRPEVVIDAIRRVIAR